MLFAGKRTRRFSRKSCIAEQVLHRRAGGPSIAERASAALDDRQATMAGLSREAKRSQSCGIGTEVAVFAAVRHCGGLSLGRADFGRPRARWRPWGNKGRTKTRGLSGRSALLRGLFQLAEGRIIVGFIGDFADQFGMSNFAIFINHDDGSCQ